MKEKKKGRKQASKHVHLYFYHMNLQLDYIYNIDFIITLNQNLEIHSLRLSNSHTLDFSVYRVLSSAF